MIKKVNFTETEKKHILFSILIISFVFAYNDKSKTFQLGYWLFNLIKTIIIVTIILVIYEYSHKYLAKKYGATTEHKILSIKQYGLKVTRKLKKEIPLGVILPILITLISAGKLFFPLTNQFAINSERKRRIGRKFQYVTNYESAKIAAFGSIIIIFFSYTLKTISLITPFTFSYTIFISNIIAIFSLVPLPKTNGSMIFFGSKTLYILTLTFILISVLLINQVMPIITLFLAAICAFITAFLYFSKFEV